MGLPTGYISPKRVNIRSGPNKPVSLSFVRRQVFTAPSTIDTDGISASHAGAGTAGTTNMTIGGALASGGVATLTPARNVVITVTHSTSVVAMSGTITGTDVHGNVVTEAWAVTATGTSKTFTGAVAFKTVTSITEVIESDASTNTIIAGDGKVLGLDLLCDCASLIKEFEDTTLRTNGVVVAGSASANADDRGTYTPNATLNGALTFTIWYFTSEPQNS